MKKNLRIGLGLSLLAACASLSSCTSVVKHATNCKLTSTTTGLIAGDFLISPELKSNLVGSIVVSDDNGNVYSKDAEYKDKENANKNNAIATTYKKAVIDLAVTYAGDADSEKDVKAAWAKEGGMIFFDVTVSDSTVYSSSSPSSSVGGYWKKDQAKILGKDVGLKFKSSQAPARAEGKWANEGNAYHASNSLTVKSIDLSKITFAKSSNVWKAKLSAAATFYIGIVNINGVAQTNSDAYSCSFTVSV